VAYAGRVAAAWRAIGIDLGGTKIEAAVVRGSDGELTIESRHRVATRQADGYDAIVERTAEMVRRAVETAGMALASAPIGVGMPGSVTRRGGLVKNSNTVCLNGRPFRDDVCRVLGRPIAFDNDATCFALAEALHGAGRAHRAGVVFGVIMGTGVGGGIVVHGRPWSGLQGIAGEWGHHGVFAGRSDARSCYCGQKGCLEVYASGPAVEAAYRELGGAPASLSDIAERRSTDERAAAAIETLLDAFGRGLANVIDVLDPSVVVLGGGLSNLGFLYDEGRDRVATYVFNDELVTPIVKNELGDSAGVVGAALLAQGAGAPIM
jgi:fructokinase